MAAGLFLAGTALVAWAQSTGQAAPSSALDESTIMERYKQYVNAGYHARPFNPTRITIKWQEGSFTRKEGREAIVLIDDVWNHQHAEGYAHLFLFLSNGEWKIGQHECVGDTGDMRTIDIEGDGRLEVWVESEAFGQGHAVTWGRLLSFAPDSMKVLFEYEGRDDTGGEPPEGEALMAHRVEFRDVDKDNIFEIIDTETVKTYKAGQEVASRDKTTAYHLQGGVFKEWRDPLRPLEEVK